MKQETKRIGMVAAGLTAALSAGAWDLKLDKEGKQSVAFHGFASQGFIWSSDYNYFGDTSDGTFEFTELGLNATMNPFPRTRITAQGFTYDLGEVGNFEPMLDYASLEYTFADYLTVRGGRVRRQQGLYNHVLDVDMTRTSIFLPQGVYDARWRDFTTSVDGGLVTGNIALGKAGSLSYEGYIGMMNLSEEGGIYEQILGSVRPLGVRQLDSLEGSLFYGGQLWWYAPVSGLRVGASYALSDGIEVNYTIPARPPFLPFASSAQAVSDTTLLTFSVEYATGPWTFQAEYLYARTDSDDYVNGAKFAERHNAGDAWYASVSRRFAPWFEAGLYHSQFYMNQSDRFYDEPGSPRPESRAYQWDTALSLRFDIKDWWIVKAEAHCIKGTGLLYNTYGQNPLAEQNRDAWFMLALKTTFSF